MSLVAEKFVEIEPKAVDVRNSEAFLPLFPDVDDDIGISAKFLSENEKNKKFSMFMISQLNLGLFILPQRIMSPPDLP